MTHDLTSAIVLLILILDPFGLLTIYIPMMAHIEPRRRTFIAIRESLIAFSVLVSFMFGGEYFLHLVHLSERSLSVSGGVILMIVSIQMIFGFTNGNSQHSDPLSEPFIVPLAVPYLAGPSAMATVMLMASKEPNNTVLWIIALAIATSFSCAVLIAGTKISHLVGKSFLIAMEKLMGLIMTALATEMILSGVKQYFFS